MGKNKLHSPACDCYECGYLKELEVKGRKADFVDPSGRTDYADAIERPATYYYDSVLRAVNPVKLKRSPSDNSETLQEFPKGANVGRIYSHVVRDGFVWWLVDWFSGKFAGYVKHDPALFSGKIAEQTSIGLKDEKQREQNKKDLAEINAPMTAVKNLASGVTDTVSGIGDLFSGIGKNFKYILIVVIVVALVFGYSKIKGATS